MRDREKLVCPSIFLVCCLLFAPLSEACTRVVYVGPDGNVITARSMDWKVDVGTNLGYCREELPVPARLARIRLIGRRNTAA
jgi:hypothetical protein